MSFDSLGLAPSLLQNLSENGYKKPTPIQEKAIPAILNGEDVLGIAKTGSGKTASYVLPILQNIQRIVDFKNRHITGLIVVPTRELAVQVHEVIEQFNKNLPARVKTLAIFGGVSVNPQMIKLQGVQLLVATPGRLLDLIDSKALHLSETKFLVLDEADKMLNLGFKDEMDRILGLLPKKRQNMLFSATLNEDIDQIKSLLLDNPVVAKIVETESEIELINQRGYYIEENSKGPLLRYLIKENDMQQVLVFASSSFRADQILDKLRKNKIDAMVIHGKRSQGSRQEALNKFKNGTLRVLVSTDLLARGIDIEFLPYVINYELPRSPKDYIHRIGRTGRAESPGLAISLIAPEDTHHFRVIQKKMKKRVEMEDGNEIDLKGY